MKNWEDIGDGDYYNRHTISVGPYTFTGMVRWWLKETYPHLTLRTCWIYKNKIHVSTKEELPFCISKKKIRGAVDQYLTECFYLTKVKNIYFENRQMNIVVEAIDNSVPFIEETYD